MEIEVNGYKYGVETIKFPAGEVNVNILKSGVRGIISPARIVISTKLRSSDDIMELLLVKDALDNWLLPKEETPNIKLRVLYMPYARQDRICNRGEAHSLKVMCNLINSMDFDSVEVADPHSTVVEGLIHNCITINQESIIRLSTELSNKLRAEKYVIVSPDAGAEKKALQVAQYFGCDMIRATKRRDIATGRIKQIGFIDPIPENRSFLIVDDICDGGGTFIPLAGELGEAGAKQVELYVTHGIFSKGTQILLDNFDSVYTTDSYYEGTDNIKVINL